MANIFDKLLGLFKTADKQQAAEKENTTKVSYTPDNPARIYKHGFHPLRKVFLWGWDDDNNPGFLVLYGQHQFAGARGRDNLLEEKVLYTDYMIFRGQGGHFPSFAAVKILDRYDYSSRKRTRKMYYTKDAKNYWTTKGKELTAFKSFKEGDAISWPYFQPLSHADCVRYLEARKMRFENFRPAQTPMDVLRLDEQLAPYYETICTIFGNPNLFLRKKHLRALLLSNPPPALYQLFLNIGSNELIAGLFLELARQHNDVLLNEAKAIIGQDGQEIKWVEGSYLAGLKRCAALYVNAFAQEARAQRIDFLRRNLHTDRIVLNVNHFKGAIQEAAVYGLPELLGQSAYYTDSPRLAKYYRENGRNKALVYFRRYLRRIFDGYAENDEDKFVTALQVLFTSYTASDYVSRFKENFQENYFIKHYLYYDFREQAPDGWYEKYAWKSTDQLMKLEGNYAFRPELWGRHVDTVVDILARAKVPVIIKAFYYLLKAAAPMEQLRDELSYARILPVLSSPYLPVAELFKELLTQKLALENEFDAAVMLQLINCSLPEVREMAMQYFARTGGRFSVAGLVSFIFTPGLADWQDLYRQSIAAFDAQEYALFWQTVLGSLSSGQSIPADSLAFLEETLFAQPLQALKTLLTSLVLSDSAAQSAAKQSHPMHPMVALVQAIKTDTLPAEAAITGMLATGTAPLINLLVQLLTERQDLLAARLATVLLLLESNVAALNELAKTVFVRLPKEEQLKLHALIIDSPEPKVYEYGLQKLDEIYEQPGGVIPAELLVHMLEHPASAVKAYIADKLTDIIKTMGQGNKELFMYYAKTLLLLPNRISAAKDTVYEVLPLFVAAHGDQQPAVEALLLDIGGSNIILDAERALVALVRIRKGAA
ncbi:MAG: hypothetical protein FWC60_10845 [Firmicutes bacterium]|nr:hypothetical protein [Bacillota bacterium]